MIISDKLKVDSEILTISSAAGATSGAYDMRGYSEAMLIMNVEGSYADAVLDLMQSSAATAAGSSAAGSKAGIQIGSSVNTSIPSGRGVRTVLLTMGTGATGATGDAITLCGKTFAFSTSTANLNSSAWSSTLLYFGSTVGSTINTGAQLSMGALRTAIESTKGFNGSLVCSTPTTNTLKITLGDDATGAITFGATGSTDMIVATIHQAVGAYNLKADQLTDGKRFLSVKVSTASTTCRAGLTVIRAGGRYLPPSAFAGKLSS